MLRWLFLLSVGYSVVACHGAAPGSPRATPTPTAAEAARVAPVRAEACRAQPSTVYGDEPVVFRIEAAQAGEILVTVTDESGRPTLKSSVVVPGSFQPPALPSGDFLLHAGSPEVTCAVTVNRELARASQPSR